MTKESLTMHSRRKSSTPMPAAAVRPVRKVARVRNSLGRFQTILDHAKLSMAVKAESKTGLSYKKFRK